MLRSPPLGTSFILFYATGTIPFRLYGAMANQVAGAINANRGLLAYPVVNPLDAVFAQFAPRLHDRLPGRGRRSSPASRCSPTPTSSSTSPPAAAAFVLAALLGLGVGTVNCVLFGFFPTWKNVWSVLSRPLFLLSGVLYLYDSVPTALPGDPLVEPAGARDRADALGLLRQLRPGLRLGALRARRRRHACSSSAAGCCAGTRAS